MEKLNKDETPKNYLCIHTKTEQMIRMIRKALLLFAAEAVLASFGAIPCSAANAAPAQQQGPRKITVTGVVYSETDEPMVGAYVVETGNKSNGAITDIDGKFSISVHDGSVLEVSSIGYANSTVRIESGKTAYTVRMDVDRKLLDEVVVIGYGSVKKSDLTYSVSKITDDAIKSRPLTMMSEAFQGTLSGVRAQAQDGVPGEDLTIRIRGTNTINGDSSPLYVVDGIPQESMRDIASGDIASIQVLKDAAATSIYGARGGKAQCQTSVDKFYT